MAKDRKKEREMATKQEQAPVRYWLDQIKGRSKLNINFWCSTAGTFVYGTGEIFSVNQLFTYGTRDLVVLLT